MKGWAMCSRWHCEGLRRCEVERLCECVALRLKNVKFSPRFTLGFHRDKTRSFDKLRVYSSRWKCGGCDGVKWWEMCSRWHCEGCDDVKLNDSASF